MRNARDTLVIVFVLGCAVCLAGLKIRDWLASSTIVGCFSVSEKFQDQCRMDQLFRQREREAQYPNAEKTQ